MINQDSNRNDDDISEKEKEKIRDEILKDIYGSGSRWIEKRTTLKIIKDKKIKKMPGSDKKILFNYFNNPEKKDSLLKIFSEDQYDFFINKIKEKEDLKINNKVKEKEYISNNSFSSNSNISTNNTENEAESNQRININEIISDLLKNSVFYLREEIENQKKNISFIKSYMEIKLKYNMKQLQNIKNNYQIIK